MSNSKFEQFEESVIAELATVCGGRHTMSRASWGTDTAERTLSDGSYTDSTGPISGASWDDVRW
ncbi:MAG: hypothetical protein AAGG75_03365 [Bacteroidota bacterium]